MINKIDISDFKCLHNEHLDFKPLTIITGLNSAGKSSLIQALLSLNSIAKNGQLLRDVISNSFDVVKNKYTNTKRVQITLTYNKDIYEYILQPSPHRSNASPITSLVLEENLYYLSSNRVGAEQFAKISPNYKVGINGEYLWGTFENEKSNALAEDLVKDENSFTLSMQLNYWLNYITGIKLELQTEKRMDESVEVKYKSDGLGDISPFQLGSGVNYLAKILIMCLRANKGDVLIIENPEIHLHPASQAKLGEFFTFIAKAGIQLIIETHCEHLMHKVGYEIYKKRYDAKDVVIFYKRGIRKSFEKIEYKANGNFKTEFPEGFFDATIDEVLEMD